jgi:hypothetical protein
MEHACAAAESDPPEASPVVVVMIDEDRDVGPGAGVSIRRNFGERFGLRSTAE